jgi:hypothetical protein
MDKATLTALKGSIRKWDAIVSRDGLDNGMENCPLCQLFANPGKPPSSSDCAGCPVREATGHRYCHGSPYDAYNEMGSMENALEMRRFLRSLLPKPKKAPGQEACP